MEERWLGFTPGAVQTAGGEDQGQEEPPGSNRHGRSWRAAWRRVGFIV